MKAHLASILTWLAAAAVGVANDEASHVTVLRQRAQAHIGPATVDVSDDGRFVAFESDAPLVPEDRNKNTDIYVLDRTSGRVTVESVTADGIAAPGSSRHPRVNGDGRYVVFSSIAPSIVESRAAIVPQVVLRDRQAGTTTLVSRTLAGTPASRPSVHSDISHDGRTVVFESAERDLVATADRNGLAMDVYVFDVRSRAIERASVDNQGQQPAAGASFAPVISGNGHHVAFVSSAPLDAIPRTASKPGSERPRQIYLRDLERRVTRRISRARDGAEPTGQSFHPAVSADGRWLAFASEATNLGARDRNHAADVYLHDTHTGETVLVSRGVRGAGAGGSSRHPTLSADGRFVAFVSDASDLECGARCPAGRADLNLIADVYLHDTLTRSTVRVSGTGGTAGPWWDKSVGPALDATGRVIAFSSLHAIDSTDVAHDFDLFVHVRPPRPEPAGTPGEMRRR